MSKSIKKILVVVNFGGPRDLIEVPSFLVSLLTDEDVIRTPFPAFFQKWFFRRIALKRAVGVAKDYEKIGGGSPIFADTEWIAGELSKQLELPTLTFHRYIESTHPLFLKALYELKPEEIVVFPLFPQFSYATTGSIARWFSVHVDCNYVNRMKWIRSYCKNTFYIQAFTSLIREFLQEKNIEEEEALLFFSAHGLPVKYVKSGDSYQKECEESFLDIKKSFPLASSLLAYQSKFGRGEWLGPSTGDLCQKPEKWLGDKKHVVIIPLSFSSDHIETLFEIEELYISSLRSLGVSAYRCPALGRRADWVNAAMHIIEEESKISNQGLIRRN